MDNSCLELRYGNTRQVSMTASHPHTASNPTLCLLSYNVYLLFLILVLNKSQLEDTESLCFEWLMLLESALNVRHCSILHEV